MELSERILQPNHNWSSIGGCSAKHPFNKEKRIECEETYMKKQSGSAKSLSAQADVELAKAVAIKSSQPSSSWTAGQTAMVIGAALLGITIMVVVIKKIANRSKAE